MSNQENKASGGEVFLPGEEEKVSNSLLKRIALNTGYVAIGLIPTVFLVALILGSLYVQGVPLEPLFSTEDNPFSNSTTREESR